MKYSAYLAAAAFLAGNAVQPADATFNSAASIFGDMLRFIGEVSGIDFKRDVSASYAKHLQARQLPPGVPEFEYTRCQEDITGLTIVVQGDGSNLQFSGVPPTCMNLANVLIGDGTEGPYALPCGSDCLSYSDLTPEQYAELTAVLRG